MRFIKCILIMLALLVHLVASVHQDFDSDSELSLEDDTEPSHGRCERIRTELCDQMPYNQTIMPNLIGHSRQSEAGEGLILFAPFIKSACSPDLLLFLCSVYFPVCTTLNKPIPPCRHMCASAYACEPDMRAYNFEFEWPKDLECVKFPEYESGELCFHRNTTRYTPSSTPSSYTPKVSHKNRNKNTQVGPHRNIGFVCPLQLKTPVGLGYALTVGGKETKDCGAPCHGMFFKESERTVLRYWVGSWAAVCCASCLFTILTFLIDPSRFRYPERAIVFLAVCYLVVGIAYVVGLGAGDTVSCREPFMPPHKVKQLQMLSTITQGHRQTTLCTVLFMALYFCSMAAFAWWACLALAWFLAAGLKWGHEAIENKSHLFHLIAWAIPALQTICVLALGKVEGDVLSGVCFVGQLDTYSLGIFLLLPLCIYLTIGAIFLLAGFISLFRIRTVMKTDGKRTDKLERLMLRIGFFSGLFILPAVGFLGCLFYEYYFFDEWMLQWNHDMCQRFSIPCPVREDPLEEDRPIFQIYMAKYVCSMLVGVTSSVWLYSGKTVVSWRLFVERMKGKGERRPRGQAYV